MKFLYSVIIKNKILYLILHGFNKKYIIYKAYMTFTKSDYMVTTYGY